MENKTQKFVSYTPFIEQEKSRIPVPIFTTLDYTQKELNKMEDTAGAVDFTIGEDGNQNGCLISLFYLLDSKYRTSQEFAKKALEQGDFAENLISLSILRLEDEKSENYVHRRKSFVVHFDAYIEALKTQGYDMHFEGFESMTYEQLLDFIITHGFKALPRAKVETTFSKETYEAQKQI